MFNNVSYRQSCNGGPTNFTFFPCRLDDTDAAGHHGLDWRDDQPAEPDQANDGCGMVYKGD